jgi:hypothetical protein
MASSFTRRSGTGEVGFTGAEHVKSKVEVSTRPASGSRFANSAPGDVDFSISFGQKISDGFLRVIIPE